MSTNVTMDPKEGPKKILYLITKGTWGGAQSNVYDLIEGTLAGGHFPVLAYGARGLLSEKAQKLGVRSYAIEALGRDISLFDEFRACAKIYSIIRTESPDVVHLHSSKVGALGAVAARLAGAPRIIFTAHAWAFTEPRSFIYRAFFTLSHYLTVLLCDKTILVSYRLKEHASFWPWVQKRFEVIYNGVSGIHFKNKHDAREELEKYALEGVGTEQGLILGTVAELHANKGLDVGIHAFAMLPPDLKEKTHWIIIGGGEKYEELRALANGEPHIHFLGFIEGASHLLKAFDVFMLPSRTEALGIVLLEAGLAGLPCLATRVGGIPEVITHQSTGLLVPQGDASALSDSLAYLLMEKEERARFGEALHTRVSQHFTKHEMLHKTLRLYE